VGVKPQAGGFDMGGDFGAPGPESTEAAPQAEENTPASTEVQNAATNGTGLEGL
jgi:hypothetical protein